MSKRESSGGVARVVFAGIRIVNGAIGLFAAHRMAAQLGDKLTTDQCFVCPARMFGIRTIVLGVDLLTLDPFGPVGAEKYVRAGHRHRCAAGSRPA
jgi:hypothetical protein